MYNFNLLIVFISIKFYNKNVKLFPLIFHFTIAKIIAIIYIYNLTFYRIKYFNDLIHKFNLFIYVI